MRCRGRGSCRLDNADFRLTILHTCVAQNPVDDHDNHVVFINILRQRATREQTNLRTIYNEEIQRYLIQIKKINCTFKYLSKHNLGTREQQKRLHTYKHQEPCKGHGEDTNHQYRIQHENGVS